MSNRACPLLLRSSQGRLSAGRCSFAYMRQRNQYPTPETNLQITIAPSRCQVAIYLYVAANWRSQLAEAFDDPIHRKNTAFRVIIFTAGTVAYVTSIAIRSPIELFQIAFEATFRYFLTVTVIFPGNRAAFGCSVG